MILLLDESVPQTLGHRLQEHTVESVASMSWLGIQNGSLMRLVEQFGFDVFVTADKNLMYQQSTKALPFALVVLSTNHWPTLRKHLPAIQEAIISTPVSQIKVVDCGEFVPQKRRKKQAF